MARASQIPITILPPSQVILEDKLPHLLNHIIVRVPRIHHNLSLVFLADARILFQWPLRPILIVVVVVVGVVPLFFGLYGGAPVTVLILIFIRLVRVVVVIGFLLSLLIPKLLVQLFSHILRLVQVD